MATTVWKGHVSFGLISIPVRLFRAARAERVKMHHLYRAPAPVIELPEDVVEEEAPPPPPVKKGQRGQVVKLPPAPETPPVESEPRVERVRQAAVTQEGERPIPPSEILKGFEIAKDRWVTIDKEELKKLAPRTSQVIDVVEFVRFADIDPVYLENSYYVVPDRNGEKPYAILYEAMKESGYAAVGQVAMHNREHVLVVRPGRHGMIAHALFYSDEVRENEEYRTEPGLVAEKELELAVTLVGALKGPFEPEKYKDTYREQLEALIAAKAEGKAVAKVAAPAPTAADVTDLVAALEKSLELAKKPPAKAGAPARGKKKSG